MIIKCEMNKLIDDLSTVPLINGVQGLIVAKNDGLTLTLSKGNRKEIIEFVPGSYKYDCRTLLRTIMERL